MIRIKSTLPFIFNICWVLGTLILFETKWWSTADAATTLKNQTFLNTEYYGRVLVTQKVVDFDLPQVTLTAPSLYSKLVIDEGKLLLDKTKKTFLFEISGFTKPHLRLWLDQKNIPVQETGYFTFYVPIQLGDTTFKLDILDPGKQRRTQLELIVTLLDYQVATAQNNDLLNLQSADDIQQTNLKESLALHQKLQIDQIHKSGLLSSFETHSGLFQLSDSSFNKALWTQQISWQNTYYAENTGLHLRIMKSIFFPLNNPLAGLSGLQLGLNYRGLAAIDSRQNFQFWLGTHLSTITLGQGQKWEINGIHLGGALNYPLSKKWWTDLQGDVAFSVLPFFVNRKISATWSTSYVFQPMIVASAGLQWENWSGLNEVQWLANYLAIVMAIKIKLG